MSQGLARVCVPVLTTQDPSVAAVALQRLCWRAQPRADPVLVVALLRVSTTHHSRHTSIHSKVGAHQMLGVKIPSPLDRAVVCLQAHPGLRHAEERNQHHQINSAHHQPPRPDSPTDLLCISVLQPQFVDDKCVAREVVSPQICEHLAALVQVPLQTPDSRQTRQDEKQAGAGKAGEPGGPLKRSSRLHGHRQTRHSEPSPTAQPPWDRQPVAPYLLATWSFLCAMTCSAMSRIRSVSRATAACGGGQQQGHAHVCGLQHLGCGVLKLLQTHRTPLTLHLWRPGVPGCALVLMHD